MTAKNDIVTIGQSCVRHRIFQIEAGDHSLLGILIRKAVVDWVVNQKRVAGEIHLCDQPRQKACPKKREVNMSRSPSIRMIPPRVGAWF